MKQIHVVSLHAVVLLICYSSGVCSGNPDTSEDKEAEEWFKRVRNIRLQNRTDADARKSKEVKARNPLPADWTNAKYLKPLKCSGTYAVAKDGFIRVPLDSPEPCSYEFLGSRPEKCTSAFYCKDKLTFKNDKCDGEFIKISDGTIGAIEMTCEQEAGFKKTPRVPRNHGSDIYVNFKGTLASECVVFCLEDSANQFDPKKHLNKNHKWKSFPQAGSCECGKRMDELGGRIVGGSDANKFEFPWLGGVVWKYPGYKRVSNCGVSLISDMHAISAAHCFEGREPGGRQLLFHFHVGNFPPKHAQTEWKEDDMKKVPGWDLPDSTDGDEKSIRVEIDYIIQHPLYVDGKLDYDVAILVFKKKVDFKSSEISPICLPRVNEFSPFEDGINMVAAGWGILSEKSIPPARILQKVDVPFVENGKCDRMTHVRTFRHICVGFDKGGKDSCSGDSGGPLITLMPGNKGQYVLSGIVSGGVGCARAGQPGLYTNVKEIIQWVYHHTASGDAKWCAR